MDELTTVGETEASGVALTTSSLGRGGSRFKRHLERVIEQKETLAEKENGDDVDIDVCNGRIRSGSFVESED